MEIIMKNIKKKIEKLKDCLNALSRTIKEEEEIAQFCRLDEQAFTRTRKIPLSQLLYHFIFRHQATANAEISYSFSERNLPTKQALIKRENQLNPQIWKILLKEFREHLEEKELLTRTLEGYRIIAIDGSTLQLPFSEEVRDDFGGTTGPYIKKTKDIKTPMARISAMLDVMNHQYLDFDIAEFKSSELTLMFKHLDNTFGSLKDQKVIFLLDRYYGSVEFFLWCEMNHFNYIVRAKSNFYKKQRASLEKEQDGFFQIHIDEAWLKRLKREDVRSFAAENPDLKIRLVKNDYYYVEKGLKGEDTKVEREKESHTEYFTNLTFEEFETKALSLLYHLGRWPIETTYDILKNDLKLEEVHTAKTTALLNMIYSKVLMFNLERSLYALAQLSLDEQQKGYIPNNKRIIQEIYSYVFFRAFTQQKLTVKLLKRIIEEAMRLKRRKDFNRHFQRWGRFYKQIPKKKFRIDGRRNPIVSATRNGGYITTNR